MKKIVAMSCWSTGGRGEYPVRVVVLDLGADPSYRYSRNLQVNDGKNDDYFIHSHHKSTLVDALVDAQQAVEENNRDFKPGNISHIPAWPNGELIRIVKT